MELLYALRKRQEPQPSCLKYSIANRVAAAAHRLRPRRHGGRSARDGRAGAGGAAGGLIG